MGKMWFIVALCAATGLVGCSGADGAQGKQGPQGEAGPAGSGGDASVNAVVPSSAFLGGVEQVTISGFATSWTDAAKVDFGAGVTVDSVAVASPTGIVASISVAFDASPGTRDVTVTDGGSSLVYKGAFSVGPATTATIQGTLAQGSLVFARVQDLDFSRPFDATTAGDGLFTPITYPNIELSTDPGIATQLQSVQAYALDTLLLIDMDQPAGKTKLDVLSGPAGGTRQSFPNPSALDVAARTPKALTLGQDASVTLQDAFSSELYSVTPGSGLEVVELSATTTNTSANPQLFVLPDSGHFTGLLGYGSSVVLASSSGAKLNAILWDNSGASGYTATVRADSTPATGGAEAEPNNTTAKAQSASSLPFVLQNASLSSASDEDWISVTATAADVGKSIRVITMPGDPQTDTLVEVFESNGTTTLGGPSDDANYHENWLSDPITGAGTYYVKISASPFYSTAQTKYDAVVRLE